MASAALPTLRRIPPPRVYTNIPRRRSINEPRSTVVYENDPDHEKCLVEENQLREINRRHLIRIEYLERDYRQLDDDLLQIQNERDLLIKQKRLLEEELERSAHHATANVDLHVYTQRLENECRDLRAEVAMREKEKFELNEMMADLDVQMKLINDRHEEWRETCNDLEVMLTNETETRQCLQMQLEESNLRQKENENQIRRLQNELDEIIASKQDIVKSNYILVQNCESLREQLRIARTQAAEIHMIRSSSNNLTGSLDESLPCLVFDENEDHTPIDDLEQNQQSSLFSEINSIETLPADEMVTKYFDGTTNDIELDLLLAKTTTLESTLTLINQMIKEIQIFHETLIQNDQLQHEDERLTTMKTLLKRIFDNTNVFDHRFRKLQLLLIASREQQQCHQAELDDFFRLVDKRLTNNFDGQIDEQPNQKRLATILEIYDKEFDRLKQMIRTNEETIRTCEQNLLEQQSAASRWRMKATFYEKNQKKLLEKIKELNSERRQMIESTNHKRTRRRPVVTIPIEQLPQSPPEVVPLTKPEFVPIPISSESRVPRRRKRTRSLPLFRSMDEGRKSRQDSGVVLTDELHPLPSIFDDQIRRRRIKSNISSHSVLHTSSTCGNQSILISNSLSSTRFQWFSLSLCLLLFFSSIMISTFHIDVLNYLA